MPQVPDRGAWRTPRLADTAESPSPSSRPRRRLRYYLALFIAWVIVPLALIVLFEVGLRAVGYGHTTDFLIEKHTDLGDFHELNMSFYKQFLYMEVENVGMEPFDVVVPPKSEDTYRVLVLGGSAALGWYFGEFGYWRSLEAMLRATCHGKRIEFICAAWFGMNTHVMRHIAEHCDVMKPDLVLVYVGNNEMTGPFGLLTRAGQADVTPRELERHIKTHLFASNMRLMQLLGRPALDLTFSIAGGKKWGFDAPIGSLSDPRLYRVYSHYELNLNAICESATRAGAQVLLSTVARNQRDWKPRISVHHPGWTDAENAAWQARMDAGDAALAAGDAAGAVQAFEAAVALDPEYAMSHFRLGQALLAAGADHSRAKEAFDAAWAWDYTLDSVTQPINDAATRVGAAWKEKGVTFVDAFAAMSGSSPGGFIGHEYLYDHIHFTQRGCYELARLFFEALQPHLAAAGMCAPDAQPLSFDQCEEWIGASPPVYAGNLKRAVDSIEGMWPEHDSTPFSAEADAILAQQTLPLPEAITAGYRRAVELNADDFVVRYRLIRQLLDVGPANPQEALAQAEELLRRHPYYWRSHLAIAEATAAAGQAEKSVEFGQALTRLYPEYPESFLQYGRLLERAGKPQDAIEAYLAAASMGRVADIPLSIAANVLEKLGRKEEARKLAERALHENPNNPASFEILARLLPEVMPHEEVVAYFAQIAERYPNSGAAAQFADRAREQTP
ncbi:MAG: tetratricopeptide repeat protein [Candidatus Hydrogenedentes bacterium]|nr:tetratricopeptide repeat protein [Candidatus Hydrogenedentota bacterium]